MTTESKDCPTCGTRTHVDEHCPKCSIKPPSNCFVHFDGWGRFASPAGPREFGRMETAVIMAETEKRFRVRFLEEWPRGDEGDVVLVPKWAVTTNENT